MIIDELIYNLSILVTLSVLSGFIDARFTRKETTGKILQGILFGTIAVIGMTFPFVLTEGIIFDGRSIVISLCTLFFGPISGIIAVIFAIVFRIASEGIGAVTGILVIISSFLIGLYFYSKKNNLDKKTFTTLRLFYFGLLVHFAMIILLLTLPTKNISQTFSIITITVIVVFPLVTVLIGKILLSQEENQKNLEELKESKQQLQFALEGSNEGVWDWNINTNEVLFTLRWKEILGFDDQEIGTSVREWETRVHPEDLGNVMAELQKHLRGEIPVYNSEHRVLCKDGSYKWILARGKVLVKNSDGSPARMVGTQKDITERKQAEIDLLKSQEDFKTYFEIGSIGMAITSPEKGWVEVNKRLLDMLGYSKEELTAFTWADLTHPDDLNLDLNFFNEVMQGKINSYELDKRFIRKDGAIIITTLNVTCHRVSDGRVDYFLASLIDITERKDIEKKLQESEERFRKIFENAKIGLYRTTPSGNILMANNELVKMLGYPSFEDLASRNIEKGGFGPSYPRKDFLEMIEKNNEIINFESEWVRLDGSTFIVSENAQVIRDSDNNILYYDGVVEDITERKRAENIIKRSEHLLKLFVENSPASIAMFDKDMKYIVNSRRYILDYGIKLENIIGLSHYEVFPEIPGRWKDIHKKCLEGVIEKCDEDPFPRSNGKLDWIRWELHPWYEPNGEIGGVILFSEVITDRKNAEEKIRQKDIQFRKLSLHLPDMIFQFTRRPDGTYHIPIASEGIKNIYGCSPEDVLEDITPIANVIFSEDTEGLFNEIEYSAKHLTMFTYEFRVQIPGKPIHWLYTKSTPERLEDGSITWYGFNADITERKEAEASIRNLSTAIEQSPVTVIITDTNGTIEYVNPKFTELTQYTFEEAIGKSPAILKSGHTTQDEYKKMWQTIMAGNEWSGLFHNKKKDGQTFWESSKISPLRNSKGKITHFIAIKEDITQRVETEKELEEYRNSLELIVASRTKEIERINKELLSEIEKKQLTEILLHQSLEKEQELNHLKSRFISTASHEFRTPLTSILSSAELIQRYGKKWEEEKYQEHLNRITSSVEYLTELMDDVLTVSKIESGKIQLNPGKINLFEICEKVISDFHLKKGFNHQLLFSYGIKEKEFYLDQKQIQIILQNLLSNAIKYSPDGGKIELTIESHKQEIYFSIEDEGLGIPDEDIPHLFEPFYRSLNAENIQGTGLGLSIVKNAVELHGGNIEVSSKLGKGTKFIITIPIRNE